jgi:hypothetical protein
MNGAADRGVAPRLGACLGSSVATDLFAAGLLDGC